MQSPQGPFSYVMSRGSFTRRACAQAGFAARFGAGGAAGMDMRIGVLTNEYEPMIIGGLGIVATRAAEALAAQGCDVVVLTAGPGRSVEHAKQNGVRVVRVPKRLPYYSARQGGFVPEAVMHNLPHGWRPDAVHIHSVPMDTLAAFWSQSSNARLVYTCHSLIALEGRGSLQALGMEDRQRRLFQAADVVTSPSYWQAKAISVRYPFAASKQEVIPNGVTRVAGGQEEGRLFRSLLFVGRLVPAKGALETIRALSLLMDRHPDARLELVGRGPGPYLGRLKAEANRLRIHRRVAFRGYLTHSGVLGAMRRCGAVVVPSRMESFGLTALEAMASGTPLVSTASGGLSEYVDPSVASVIKSPTAREIARSVESLWSDFPKTEQRRRMALIRARRYTWDRIAAMYLSVFAQSHKESVEGG